MGNFKIGGFPSPTRCTRQITIVVILLTTMSCINCKAQHTHLTNRRSRRDSKDSQIYRNKFHCAVGGKTVMGFGKVFWKSSAMNPREWCEEGCSKDKGQQYRKIYLHRTAIISVRSGDIELLSEDQTNCKELIRPGANFIDLLTVSKKSALTEARNSVSSWW